VGDESVAEFLVNFREQLKRHIARRSLTLAGCSYKEPQQPTAVKLSSGKLVTATQRWKAATEAYEPVTTLGTQYKIYQRIGESFVDPRVTASDKLNYSILLYGPPGTGKTTVAATLGWTLDFPLITVTVSDFLADGHAAIEARAKDLFDMLRAQPQSIVLFDEIDQFMLDRDSEYFKDQETVFQFLTPGMLTKLADLRSSESVIFIMATNYAERIDAAIKRQGRIDMHCLLLPPDRKRRRSFVVAHWAKGSVNVDEAARESVFLGYGDITSVQKDVIGDDAIRRLKFMPRPAAPSMYRSRFENKTGARINDLLRTPRDELFAMLLLDANAIGLRVGEKAWEAHIREKCFDIFDRKNVAKIGHALTDFLESIAVS
jgi:hypothetical protein